jgi:EpsI family protein
MRLVLPFQRAGSLLALGILLIVTCGFHLHLDRLKNIPAVDVPIESIPEQLGPWKSLGSKGMDIRSQEILKLTRYVKRTYERDDGKTVALYIGYWEKQSGDYQAAKHSPLLCLPSNGWQVRHKTPAELSFPTTSTKLVQSKRIVGEIGNHSSLFYYWFFTGEDNYSEEWRALLNISIQKFFFGRSDGGIIEVSTPLPTGLSRQAAEADAGAVVEDFLNHLYPELNRMLSKPVAASAKPTVHSR